MCFIVVTDSLLLARRFSYSKKCFSNLYVLRFFFKKQQWKQTAMPLPYYFFQKNLWRSRAWLWLLSSRETLKCPQLLQHDKEKGGENYSFFRYWDLIDVLARWLLSLLPPSASRSTILHICWTTSQRWMCVYTLLYMLCASTDPQEEVTTF